VSGTRSVARLTGDVDLRPRGLERGGRRVEALAKVGRVALGALGVPRLRGPGPVERARRAGIDVGIQVEPALTTLLRGPRVPGQGQHLVPTAGEADDVLLQRLHAQRVHDLEVGEGPVAALRPDEETVTVPSEGRCHAAVRERRVPEVSQHGLVARPLHREVVVRSGPRRELRRVAARAAGGARVRPPAVGARLRRATGERHGQCESRRGPHVLVCGVSSARTPTARSWTRRPSRPPATSRSPGAARAPRGRRAEARACIGPGSRSRGRGRRRGLRRSS